MENDRQTNQIDIKTQKERYFLLSKYHKRFQLIKFYIFIINTKIIGDLRNI